MLQIQSAAESKSNEPNASTPPAPEAKQYQKNFYIRNITTCSATTQMNRTML
jgi:hypothetical protein